MKRYQKFLVFWFINSIILFLSNILLPKSVTIGNSIFAAYQAIVFSGFILSVILWYADNVLKDFEISPKNTAITMFVYLAVNFATIWFIARFSFMTGIGIANFWIVLLIAVAANLIQYITWQNIDKKK